MDPNVERPLALDARPDQTRTQPPTRAHPKSLVSVPRGWEASGINGHGGRCP